MPLTSGQGHILPGALGEVGALKMEAKAALGGRQKGKHEKQIMACLGEIMYCNIAIQEKAWQFLKTQQILQQSQMIWT